MGDALDLRRCFAVVAGVFLVSFPSVCFSVQKDISVTEASQGDGQGVAGHWGKWSCSSLASIGNSYPLRNAICCHVQHCSILATSGVDVVHAGVAVIAIPAAQLSVAGEGQANNCIWMSQEISFAHIMTVGCEIVNEPCAVPPSVFLPNLGYEASDIARQNPSCFGSDIAGSVIPR